MMHYGDNRRLDPIDFKALKTQISILKVLELFDWRPTKKRGDELRGPCPVHGSKSPTSTILAVSTSKNAWKCHKCEAGGNQLDLAAHYFGLRRDQCVRVAVALCRELGREIPRIE
ncbi:DNA primase [Bythopirellula polymerisocia]|uniref:DNA primase n=2 Tax=Bythopirellula polymerisocia TaxID=2528003 RepID=A0A5C6C9F9_9BACT|nr:DNA primase [Bythopirellula polymerisocia]